MRSAFGLAAFAAATAFASTAAAETYGRVDVAWGAENEVELTASGPGGSAQDTADAEDVVSISGAVGTKFGFARVEAELNYTVFDGSDEDGAELTSIVGFANVYLDSPPVGPARPYAGAGLGFGQTELETDIFSGDDTGLAWNLMVGAGFALGERTTLDVGYRYLVLPEAELQDRVFGVPVNLDLESNSHQLKAGLRFTF